jgi:hypothetical protein
MAHDAQLAKATTDAAEMKAAFDKVRMLHCGST